MTSMRMKGIRGIEVGDRFRVVRTFTEKDVTAFAATTRDYNPVHFDERFTAAKGFKGRICHGLLVGSLLTQIGGQVGWLATEMNFRFVKPVYIGDTIACDLVIEETNERGAVKANVVFSNSDDVVVLTARVAGIMPGNQERAIMERMVAEKDPTNPIGGLDSRE
jgi:3-hydroxybutyryl-CoA dehydratase